MKNLVEKSSLTIKVFDQNQDVVGKSAQVSDRIQPCKSVEEALDGAKRVITMLPNDAIVADLYSKVDKSSVDLCVDCSTVSPLLVRSLSKTLPFIDAPVSGGVNGAINSTLTFMLGGEDSFKEKARTSLLSHMGANIFDVGSSGNGQVAKLANNLLLGIQMIGVSEALTFGKKLGVDVFQLRELINASTGHCWVTDKYSPVPDSMDNVPSANNFEGGFGSQLMSKDLGLAIKAGKEVNAQFILGELVDKVYKEISSREDMKSKDFGVVFKYLEE
eukprot:augustus_masked-scaffold_14-processed-gene-11.68-mRNA-1 protein AED:0.04 eAED:0.04 QI:0/-1/0/1/-1/1/1/0/273